MVSRTVTEQAAVKTKIGTGVSGPRGRKNPGGSGGRGNGGGDGFSAQDSPERYRIGMWIALASIFMLFTALTSAYIVRAGTGNDWRPIAMPRLLWVSTALILTSSVTISFALGALKRKEHSLYKRWLLLTVVLGLGFLATQLLSWQQLVAQHVYVSTNPHSSFFYLLTAVHGAHLLGGIFGLDFLLLRSWRKAASAKSEAKREAAASAVALYWHFMDGLWIFLFLLLFLWR
ncbi:MAG: cytochrome c oxidase subunit [Blastocatellia bacterium]|jgi:cytochrome c oxidase subunit 3|nr:cytochrome c oxidase subunit [Blastocatellia bacterium]